MKLHEYLQRPDALSPTELAEAIGAKGAAQVRQWRHGYANRRPSPANCSAIVRATGGLVRPWDLRSDWYEIWPHLVNEDDAPAVPVQEIAA